jgi:hypothetical protein
MDRAIAAAEICRLGGLSVDRVGSSVKAYENGASHPTIFMDFNTYNFVWEGRILPFTYKKLADLMWPVVPGVVGETPRRTDVTRGRIGEVVKLAVAEDILWRNSPYLPRDKDAIRQMSAQFADSIAHAFEEAGWTVRADCKPL